jgi:lipopolysaccharide transport system ATP-binding protein
MNDTVIQVEGLSKQYRLGEVTTGTLSHDLNRWWHRVRGRPDPYLTVTQANTRVRKPAVGDSDGNGRAGPLSASQRWTARDRPSPPEYIWALNDINLEVRRGEVLGIVGANGAGKSTLLKILSRITAPTRGEVRVKGRMTSLLEVGTGFHPELTGRENVFLNGAILGMTRAEIAGRLEDIVEFSGCGRYLDTPVKRYSSGMTVRLGFAVAAHLEPDILIIDEVLAVGDAEFQKKCLGKMQNVAREGRTVLFVSHNMAAVRSLCGVGMLLREGCLAFRGDTSAAIDLYTGESLRSEVSTPIAERTRDHGVPVSLEAKIVGFDVYAEGAANPPTLDAFRPFVVEFAIETDADTVRCGAQFVVSDGLQNLVMCDSASFHGVIFQLKRGRNRVRCDVEPLQLAAGDYAITCLLSLPNQGVIDYVPNAYRFQVTECDPNRTGMGLNKRSCFALWYVKHRWQWVG